MATAKKKSVFETLSEVNVTPYVEKKGGLDYLSWATAWSLLKKYYPKSARKIYEHDHTGLNFFTDGQTAYVKVGITVEGEEHIDMLPVMDYRNKSISIDKMTSFDVNKTIQRATAKAIAMHGLGISLWTGEDLFDNNQTQEAPKKVSPKTPKKVVLNDIPADKMIEMLDYVSRNKKLGFKQIVANIEQKYNVNKKQEKQISDALNS